MTGENDGCGRKCKIPLSLALIRRQLGYFLLKMEPDFLHYYRRPSTLDELRE